MNDTRFGSGLTYLILFCLCIPAANWMIGNVGTEAFPGGPHVIPVAPGLEAPSGVLMIGLALVLRDLVQRRLGVSWAFAAIVAGVGLSALVAPPELVVASALAFFISETADMAVYTPLQKRNLVMAVLLSGAVGLVLDSMVFLYVAFGSLDFIWGQIVGKAWMILLALPVIHLLRRREEALA